jgi:hypothetical protein
MEDIADALLKLATERKVKGFGDVIIQTTMCYLNDRYQVRNPDTGKLQSCAAVVIEGDQYIIRTYFPAHSVVNNQDYVINGSNPIEIRFVVAAGSVSQYLAYSEVLTKDKLDEIIDEAKDETVVKFKAYMKNFNAGGDVLYPLTIKFKKLRFGLIITEVALSLPVDVCDEWYQCAKRLVYQEKQGLS